MDVILKATRWIAGVIFLIVAPLILIVIGALIAGFGISKEWSWVTNGGAIICALGIFWTFRMWWSEDWG